MFNWLNVGKVALGLTGVFGTSFLACEASRAWHAEDDAEILKKTVEEATKGVGETIKKSMDEAGTSMADKLEKAMLKSGDAVAEKIKSAMPK